MPLQPLDHGCSVIDREADGGQWGPPCDQPATTQAVWRFESGPMRIQLCDAHAADLADQERLLAVRRTT